ncbi:hypothetical protein, conserved [Leishmania tarentolae]|uniref:Uncharacterized protein n=1 Tax=Leishmania tarentolae TaxID=5689 RepID=A0A640KNC8_LEITA|nr:hypothetical protein, conserved [Leishmania tarentolae]
MKARMGRFCAEDKMTGGAYEIRSRKLELETEQRGDDAGCRATHRNLSPNDLRTIKRQQERINALLTATAYCTVPPCVSLPIDVYIQEQPSTGDTYVASVDAFSGLSLGDIIRSGWGMMEESVFLEILNAVEAFGYASASLPPHGNLSSDAIKQLLIVRDGASEARQPSRWVVSDWLLLSDDSVASFNIETFVSDLEWVLHSSFAQLHISTSTAQGSTVMPMARVEELVSETVDRIRAHLLCQGAEAQETSSADDLTSTPDGVPQTNMKALHAHLDASSFAVTDIDGTGTGQTSASKKDGVPTPFDAVHGNTSNCAAAATGSALESHATAGSTLPPDSLGEPDTETESITTASSLSILPTASLFNKKSQGSRAPALKNESAKEVFLATRQMSLKDKVAYHQAALRSEQLLVNKHRRKNAPLPPRPQPMSTHKHNARRMLSPSASEEEFYYSPPSLTSPIDVKPSAYLMQGHVSSPNGRETGSSRKLQSPRSGRTLNGEARTPRERSRLTTPPPQSQQLLATSQPSASCEQLRERLLDGLVSIAVLNQRRRAQDHRLQQEAERRRREQRQQVLSLSAPSHGQASQHLSSREVLENSRASISYPTAPSSPSVEAKAVEKVENYRQTARRRGTAPSGSAADASQGDAAAPSGDCVAPATPPDDAALNRVGGESMSPEPRRPSPHWCRIVRPTFCEKRFVVKAAAVKRVAPPRPSTRTAATAAVARRLRQPTGKTMMVPPQTVAYGVRSGTSATMVKSDAAKTPANGRSPPTVGAVATTATGENGTNLSRHVVPPAVPHSGRSTANAGNRAAWVVGRQQRSARSKVVVPGVQRNPRASTASPLASPQEKTVPKATAEPFVESLPLSSIPGRIVSPRKVPTRTGASSPLPASHMDVEQRISSRRAAATSLGSFPHFSNSSTRKCAMNVKFEVLPYPNTARTPPTQVKHAMSPRVYQRVLSTGALHSPRNGPSVTPLRRSAAMKPATVPQSSSVREVPRSARQKTAKLESVTPTALRTTQRQPRVAGDSISAKDLASVNRKPSQRLGLQKVSASLSTRHPRTVDTQNTDVSPILVSEDKLTSPRTPPPRTATDVASAGVIRGCTASDLPAENNIAEVENCAPRGGDAGGSSTSRGTRSMASSVFSMQRSNTGKALVSVPCTERVTLGSVRPVKKASPGIALLRHQSATT